MENIIYLVSLLILFIFLFAGMNKAPKGKFIKDFFSLSVSKGIQGLFGVCVIFHHICVYLIQSGENTGLFHAYFYIGIFIVGYFFFCSGYGLIYSLNTKQDYLNGFIKKRVFIVLVPFFICNYTYMISSQLMGVRYSLVDLIASFFGVILLNGEMWFAIEIMILYLLFFIIFKLIKKQNIAMLIMSICVIAIILFALYAGRDFNCLGGATWFHGEWWYNTTFLFVFGMLFASKRDVIIHFLQKRYISVFIITGIVFYILFQCNRFIMCSDLYGLADPKHPFYLERAIALILQVGAVISFIILLLLVMMKVRFSNRVLQFLGEFSLEIMLINYVFIEAFDEIRTLYGIGIYMLLVVSLTVISAVFINRIKLIVLENNKKFNTKENNRG